MRTKLPGILVTTAILVGGYALWRSSFSGRPDLNAPPQRGGQIVATIPADPRSFNPLGSRIAADLPPWLFDRGPGDSEDGRSAEVADVIDFLTQGRLVRINRSTFELEPWLAESWESSEDGRTHTLHLRPGVTWSDGTLFTSADVVFSLQAAFEPSPETALASSLTVAGEAIRVAAPDAHTVVFTYPGPSGPGLRLLDRLIILPKHKLEAARRAGRFASAWGTSTPPSEMTGTGPFVLREYQRGRRLAFDRNPRYWRSAPDGGTLPYLDRIVLEIAADHSIELARLQSGTADLMHGELRPEDYVPVRRAEAEGRLRLLELGVSTSADAFWFCLKSEVKKNDPRFAFVERAEFRQAISHAVDRERFAEKVFPEGATPIWGPVTPGNRPWFWPDIPRYPPDAVRARELLGRVGLEDRDGNGVVEDTRDTEARFTVLTEQGVDAYERGTAILREDLALVGIGLEITPLSREALTARVQRCDYDAVYWRPSAAALDPAASLDFWLSSGSGHVWNPRQRAPATDWERRIDTLMLEQVATTDVDDRRQLFNLVQRIAAEHLPVLFFAAPRLNVAHSARVTGVSGSVLRPYLLWSADTLSAAN